MNHYAPYGIPWGEQGTAQTPFGFTGEPTDQNNLVHLRARYYSPVLGVFPSLDPLEGDIPENRSLNRYGYVQGNPANFTDPIGMFAERPESYSGCQQTGQSRPCVQSPAYDKKAQILLDSSDPYGGFFSTWGVILTSACSPERSWTTQQKDHLRSAFNQIDTRLRSAAGKGFKDVFRGLEIRHLDRLINGEGDIGETASGDLVYLANAPTGINTPSTNPVTVETITHELGHVLENRTRLSSVGMLETAYNYRKNNVWLPPREDIAPGKAQGGSGEVETIADYFLFWVNHWYDGALPDTDPDALDIAKVYMDGGWINVARGDDCTSYTSCTPRIGLSYDRRNIYIGGMSLWATQGQNYGGSVYAAFADLVYRDLR